MLAATVEKLATEFSAFKTQQPAQPVVVQKEKEAEGAWNDRKRTNEMRTSLCIKSNGTPVNMKRIEEIATNNSIQISKTNTKENGDVYVDMPSSDNRERLIPLLEEESFAQNEVVKLKSKQPSITILGVEKLSSKEEFMDNVKKQNPKIREMIEQGSEFSIVFAKEARENEDRTKKSFCQVVARVSEDLRKMLKSTGDRIYIGLVSHRIVDRFFVKRCNKCQGFGHYENECPNETCCGYCQKNHKSSECDEKEEGDHESYECINCKKANKPHVGHSSLWHKCPCFLEQQKKVKQTIPYYTPKNK